MATIEEGNLTCSVCLEYYISPRLLPCLHIFCLSCLKQIVSDDDSITCPQCRIQHKTPSGGVQGFLEDSSLVCLLQSKANKVKVVQSNKMCRLCTGNNCAVMYCRGCLEPICENCQVAHKTLKPFQCHQLCSLEDVISDELSFGNFCYHHPRQEIDLYCRDCRTVICCKCVPETHKKHNYCFFSEVQGELTDMITSTMSTIEKNSASNSFHLEYAVNLESFSNLQRDRLESQINQSYDSMMSHIEVRRHEALNNLHQISDRRDKNIWDIKNRLEMESMQQNSCIAFGKRLQQQLNDETIPKAPVQHFLNCSSGLQTCIGPYQLTQLSRSELHVSVPTIKIEGTKVAEKRGSVITVTANWTRLAGDQPRILVELESVVPKIARRSWKAEWSRKSRLSTSKEVTIVGDTVISIDVPTLYPEDDYDLVLSCTETKYSIASLKHRISGDEAYCYMYFIRNYN